MKGKCPLFRPVQSCVYVKWGVKRFRFNMTVSELVI